MSTEWRVTFDQHSGGGYHTEGVVFDHTFCDDPEAEARQYAVSVKGPKGRVLNNNVKLHRREVTEWVPA